MSEHDGQASYGQFCPIAMATEVIGGRWTLPLLRELCCGSVRFNDLRRGLVRMSPALLSKRLKELAEAGVLQIVPGAGGHNEYHLTEAGQELRPVVMAVGDWGQRWVESRLSLRNLDPTLLMWDMRRGLNLKAIQPGRHVVQFRYPELPERRQSYWLLIENGEAELCNTDPGFEVDLLVEGELVSMTKVWMGMARISEEVRSGRLSIEGEPKLSQSVQDWLGLSPFARIERRVA